MFVRLHLVAPSCLWPLPLFALHSTSIYNGILLSFNRNFVQLRSYNEKNCSSVFQRSKIFPKFPKYQTKVSRLKIRAFHFQIIKAVYEHKSFFQVQLVKTSPRCKFIGDNWKTSTGLKNLGVSKKIMSILLFFHDIKLFKIHPFILQGVAIKSYKIKVK